MDFEQYIDIEEVRSRVLGNNTILIKLFHSFLSSVEFEKLIQSIDSKDYSTAANIAHGIKGMSGNLSLKRLYSVTTQLNEELKLGDPNDSTVNKYKEELKNTLEAVQEFIKTQDPR